jgi:tetratricopeptide (TPR) repeat protein
LSEEQIKNKLKLVSQFLSENKNLHALQILNGLILEVKDKEIYFQIAELYESMGFVESGKKILLDLIEINPPNDKFKLFLGQYLLRNSKWFDVIEILNEISVSNPTSLFLIGYSYMMLKEFEFKQEANIYLANIEYELNQFNSALHYAKNAQYLYADFWELNLILAKVYYSLEMFTHAITPIQKALKLNPKEAIVKEFAGKIYFKLEDFKKAENYFTEFIEMSSEVSAEIYTLLAKSFLKQRKSEEAKLFFELALNIDPAYSPAMIAKKELI